MFDASCNFFSVKFRLRAYKSKGKYVNFTYAQIRVPRLTTSGPSKPRMKGVKKVVDDPGKTRPEVPDRTDQGTPRCSKEVLHTRPEIAGKESEQHLQQAPLCNPQQRGETQTALTTSLLPLPINTYPADEFVSDITKLDTLGVHPINASSFPYLLETHHDSSFYAARNCCTADHRLLHTMASVYKDFAGARLFDTSTCARPTVRQLFAPYRTNGPARRRMQHPSPSDEFTTWTHRMGLHLGKKRVLQEAGLGEIKITIPKTNSFIDLRQKLSEFFPKLKEAGGFQLLRSAVGSRNLLEVIRLPPEGYTTQYLADRCGLGQAMIYVRQLQTCLSVSPVKSQSGTKIDPEKKRKKMFVPVQFVECLFQQLILSSMQISVVKMINSKALRQGP
ncbi:hypothetical protein MAR_017861 [Mya arenaria]|uniref:Uncharacterized protein n=1 Tax=Mya arenaria TaxID=6604 RepID=A0ABY7ED10_MYAAR|nr:hypothetical protein MAR_017861 [Mya arenaria]